MIKVVEVGASATVQDLGRVGHGHLGVPRAGPVDESSHRLANRLLGNKPEAATIEMLLGSCALEFSAPSYIVVTGAPAPVTVDGRPAVASRPTPVGAGSRMVIGRPLYGLWTYLGVRGGVAVDPVLGSRATDTLSGLGPPPITSGTELPIGDAVDGPMAAVDLHGRGVSRWTAVTFRVSVGPRYSWFPPEARETLIRTSWKVSAHTNRIAARLDGPALPLQVHQQLPTEGLHPGSIQVPSSGIPIVHLANHPPTGGYPVIAIVEPNDLSTLAQCPPGTAVHFSFRGFRN